MSKRTDCHRPGAIVPRDYECILSYSLGTESEPSVFLKEAREVWMPAGRLPRAERFGSLGQCGVCGAHFRHGDIYVHVPTGHLVTMGQDCGQKYELFAQRDAWNAEIEALKKGRAARIEAIRRQDRRDSFCATVPGLAEILKLDHALLADMGERLGKWGELSEKQIALAFKVASELWKPRYEERHVPAPEGRQAIRGIVVSKKAHEGGYGITTKLTIKVREAGGATWLAWGTAPEALFGTEDATRVEVGDEVELTGTLTRGRDAHFAFFKRPAKARIVAKKDTTPADEVFGSDGYDQEIDGTVLGIGA